MDEQTDTPQAEPLTLTPEHQRVLALELAGIAERNPSEEEACKRVYRMLFGGGGVNADLTGKQKPEKEVEL